MKEWIYMGCHGEPGHYLFNEGMRRFRRYGWPEKLKCFDGLLALQTDTTPYVATVSRLGGQNVSALAFWDYSVDTRAGSNSIVFAPSMTITPEELLTEAQRRFPEVFSRLPQPVTLHASAVVPTSERTPFAQRFIDTIHSVEQRCMAADGPVTPTCKEITDDELRALYQAAQQAMKSEGGRG
jgi:hypothetical protein